MAVEFDISWAGRSAADFSRVFKTAANIDNFRPVLNQIAEDVIGPSIGKNFEAQGRPKWAPLADSTVEKKSRMGLADPSRILFHSGFMAETASDPNMYGMSKQELRAFPVPQYWVFHQTGTNHVPQRTIMMLQVEDRHAIMRLFANYVRTFMVFDPRLPGARQMVGG